MTTSSRETGTLKCFSSVLTVLWIRTCPVSRETFSIPISSSMSGIRTSSFRPVPIAAAAVVRVGAGGTVAAARAAVAAAVAAVPARAVSARLPNRESVSESEYPICSPSSEVM